MSKRWSEEELKDLKKVYAECDSELGAAKRFRETHPDRSLDAIRYQLKKHSEWIKDHTQNETSIGVVEKSAIQTDGHLGVSREDLEAKAPVLLEILRQGPVTVNAISEDPRINIPKEAVWPLIDILREQGYDVVKENRRVCLLRHWPEVQQSLPPLTKRNRIEALFMEGSCLGLKTQQGDLLATCLAIGEQREVFFAVMLGNLVAGLPPKTRKGEYFLTNVDEQAEYVISRYPRVSFNTWLLCGARELSFRKKGEIIESLICSAREDIRYLGDEKTVIPIGRESAKAAIVSHEAQAYTKSYPIQGIAENLQEAVYYIFERSEPFRTLLVGGSHSGILLPRQLPVHPDRYNDFDVAAVPTLHRLTYSQTVSRRRGASPVLGCLVLGANFSDKGEFTSFTYAFYDLTSYFKDNDYLEDVPLNGDLGEEARKILTRLKKKPATPGELSRLVGRAIKKQDQGTSGSSSVKSLMSVEELIGQLRAAGYQIEFNEVRRAYELQGRKLKEKFKPLELQNLFKTSVKLLLSSDWHVGHYGERPDLIKKVFEIAQERKVDIITCSGNLFEGFGSYEGQALDVTDEGRGADAQRDRLLEILPHSDIPLVVIGSPLREHDGVFWVKAGHDIVDTFTRMAQLMGYRVIYIKTPKNILRQKGAHGKFKLKDIMFDMQHPKGGLPYGQTYRIQRRLEMLVSSMNLVSGVKATFIGHLHRAAFMLYKGMTGFLVPCLKDSPEDEYITALDKMAELGVWVVEMVFDEFKNITKVELEYIPFEPRSEYIRVVDMDDVMAKWEVDTKNKRNEKKGGA